MPPTMEKQANWKTTQKFMGNAYHEKLQGQNSGSKKLIQVYFFPWSFLKFPNTEDISSLAAELIPEKSLVGSVQL